MANDEQHYFANDGTDWTTPPSPVNGNEARENDKALDEQAEGGDGPTATNEGKLHHSFIEQPEDEQPAEEEDSEEDSTEDDSNNG